MSPRSEASSPHIKERISAMTRPGRARLVTVALFVVFVASMAPATRADLIITIDQEGSNVVAKMSPGGSIDLTGMTLLQSNIGQPSSQVVASFNVIDIAPLPPSMAVDRYFGS